MYTQPTHSHNNRTHSYSPFEKRLPQSPQKKNVLPQQKPLSYYKQYNLASTFMNYNPIAKEKNPILLQLLKGNQAPGLINPLCSDSIADLQNFLSQQIYRYIIANNHRYSGTSPNRYQVDVSEYKLTTEQLQDSYLRKSVLVMMNQYLQFMVDFISEYSKIFEMGRGSLKQPQKDASPSPQKSNGMKKISFGTQKLNTNTNGKQEKQEKQDKDIEKNKDKNIKDNDVDLTEIEKRILEKEKKLMEQYLKKKQNDEG